MLPLKILPKFEYPILASATKIDPSIVRDFHDLQCYLWRNFGSIIEPNSMVGTEDTSKVEMKPMLSLLMNIQAIFYKHWR